MRDVNIVDKVRLTRLGTSTRARPYAPRIGTIRDTGSGILHQTARVSVLVPYRMCTITTRDRMGNEDQCVRGHAEIAGGNNTRGIRLTIINIC